MEQVRHISVNWGREVAWGFLYWLGFLLALEPGNLARAAALSSLPPWDQELIRIVAASLLGGSSTPLVMALMRRFPIEGHKRWRHAGVQSVANAAIALGLIFVSCVLAAWFKIGDSRPPWVALPDHIASNWLLLFFCLCALITLAHAIRFFRQAQHSNALVAQLTAASRDQASQFTYPRCIEVADRGRVTLVDVALIDWVETQGNYMALHVSGVVHLIRETSVRLEEKLDPALFLRIHRRTLVAINRVRDVAPLTNGDGEVTLVDGTRLRVSRRYRDRLRCAISESALKSN